MGDVKEVLKSGNISILGRCVPEARIRKTPYTITLELSYLREVTPWPTVTARQELLACASRPLQLMKPERLESKTDKEHASESISFTFSSWHTPFHDH